MAHTPIGPEFKTQAYMNHHKEREEREKAYSFDSTSLKAHRRAKAQEAYPSSKQAPMQELPFYSVLPYVLDVLDAGSVSRSTINQPTLMHSDLLKSKRKVNFELPEIKSEDYFTKIRI